MLNDANQLLKSSVLTARVSEIIENMDEEERSTIVSARRRQSRRNGQPQDIIDLVFSTTHVPRSLFIWSVRIFVTPSIPSPKRCFYCQHFGHVLNQCRSGHPNCEFCAERHDTKKCNNPRPGNICFNCSEDHKASSRDCPVYKYEFQLMKERYLHNISKEMAYEKLNDLGWVNPRNFFNRSSSSSNSSTSPSENSSVKANKEQLGNRTTNISTAQLEHSNRQLTNNITGSEAAARAHLGLLNTQEMVDDDLVNESASARRHLTQEEEKESEEEE
ncbi:uncharacterized protein LOC122504067 isoform X2 [Leptopilina heterotoma]|uniref:uncharacterized protein LOC122504067 isoform X2 n=1 Tax=Leptopilina heterotoma TaxID=63436 RepID=UPI001CA9D1AD|nr:uncharacterized protein LOC122504067 isoform X2 [Leptopilina heterotoma]